MHPKATSLRMHSMRKRRVTTKFTMVKKSNKTAGASWYYKIHPTHRRNTTQILIHSAVRPAYHILCIFSHISISLYLLFNYTISVFDRSFRLFFVQAENPAIGFTEEIFLCAKINLEICLLLWDKKYFSNLLSFHF